MKKEECKLNIQRKKNTRRKWANFEWKLWMLGMRVHITLRWHTNEQKVKQHCRKDHPSLPYIILVQRVPWYRWTMLSNGKIAHHQMYARYAAFMLHSVRRFVSCRANATRPVNSMAQEQARWCWVSFDSLLFCCYMPQQHSHTHRGRLDSIATS